MEENDVDVLALVIYRDESVWSTPRWRCTRGLNGGVFGSDSGGRKMMTDRWAILISEAERKEADCCELGLDCQRGRGLLRRAGAHGLDILGHGLSAQEGGEKARAGYRRAGLAEGGR